MSYSRLQQVSAASGLVFVVLHKQQLCLQLKTFNEGGDTFTERQRD